MRVPQRTVTHTMMRRALARVLDQITVSHFAPRDRTLSHWRFSYIIHSIMNKNLCFVFILFNL